MGDWPEPCWPEKALTGLLQSSLPARSNARKVTSVLSQTLKKTRSPSEAAVLEAPLFFLCWAFGSAFLPPNDFCHATEPSLAFRHITTRPVSSAVDVCRKILSFTTMGEPWPTPGIVT